MTHSASSKDQPIDPKDFVHAITNPYLPLKPGTTLYYEGDTEDGHVTQTYEVTRNTVVIRGVTCIEVLDTEYLDGEVTEVTRDWFAQDRYGNVWYFGEFAQQFEDGMLVGTEGSWKAGVDGARPGIVMKADPQEGDVYRQEFAPGVAEDMGEVVNDDATARVPYGLFDDIALQTRDFSALDPELQEFKFYVPGLGQVLAIDLLTGEREKLVKVKTVGLSSNDALTGNVGVDVLIGNGGNDDLCGRWGDDIVRGGTGDDVLKGGAGEDMLVGDDGADTVYGGRHDDLLTGGANADVFLFSWSLENGIEELDVITDYSRAAGDAIDLPDGAGSVEAEKLVAGVWRLILEGDGDAIRLRGAEDADGDGHILDDILLI
jgi:hypothetical protein